MVMHKISSLGINNSRLFQKNTNNTKAVHFAEVLERFHTSIFNDRYLGFPTVCKGLCQALQGT